MNPRQLSMLIGAPLILGVIVFFVLVHFRSEQVAPPPAKLPGNEIADSALATTPAEPQRSTVNHTAALATTAVAPPAEEPYPELVIVDSEEFTEADVIFSEQPVIVDLGEYTVQSGDEFDIDVSLSAPPLASFFMIFEFDKDVIQYVPETATRVGTVLQHDLEFHAHPKGGRIALINGGKPGSKNTSQANHDKAMTFTMRALQPGRVDLAFSEGNISFTNGHGEMMDYEVQGGTVWITD